MTSLPNSLAEYRDLVAPYLGEVAERDSRTRANIDMIPRELANLLAICSSVRNINIIAERFVEVGFMRDVPETKEYCRIQMRLICEALLLIQRGKADVYFFSEEMVKTVGAAAQSYPANGSEEWSHSLFRCSPAGGLIYVTGEIDFGGRDVLGLWKDMSILSQILVVGPMSVAGWSFGVDHEIGLILPMPLLLGGAIDLPSPVHGNGLPLYAFWRFVDSPVVSAGPVRFSRAERHRSGINKADEWSPRVITLRRQEARHGGEGHAVDWTCRWFVRGHWRNQWCPGLKAHRPTWILPHTKGPQGKPLKISAERLFSVSR
jgi:hypothetical protein